MRILARSLPVSLVEILSRGSAAWGVEQNVASIVVFDEEMDSCNLLRRILEGEGHAVTACGDSDEAFRLIASNPPDLVIAHIRAGNKETVELASRIKRMNSKLTVMTISDYFSEAVEPDIADASS